MTYHLQPLWRLMNQRPVLVCCLALAAWVPFVWVLTMVGGILEGMGL